MRFFKRLLKKSNLDSSKIDDSDAIFSLSSASLILEEKLNVKFDGVGSLCVKIIHGGYFTNTINDCENFLNVSKDEFNFKYEIVKDSFGYLWFKIIGQDSNLDFNNVTNIAAAISSIGDIIEENGFSNQILCVIFKFNFLKYHFDHEQDSVSKNQIKVQDSATQNDVYIIYNYKTNNFYPFIPGTNKNKDLSKQMAIISLLGNAIPIENDFSKWFPINDIPF